MAIEYSVLLDPSWNLESLGQWITTGSLLEAAGDKTFVAPGITCVLLPQSELGSELVNEKFSLTLITKMAFRLDKGQLHDSGIHSLVDIVLQLLTDYHGDLLMLSNGEQAILMRLSGAIYIDSQDRYWIEKWQIAFQGLGIMATAMKLPSL